MTDGEPSERVARAEDLFFAAIARPLGDRVEWIRAACAGDEALFAEVSSLVAAAERAAEGPHEFLERPVTQLEDAGRMAAQSLLGHTVGEFTLLDVLGEGGMGIVFRAEQANPKRIVALKLIRPGLASAAMLKRFEIEAEALGRLRHPGIAAIHAAGTADLGAGPQPYLAMEFVEGLPLRTYLLARKPDMRTRARLVASIADAVQHAHQNGVIHRDLKPDNILVEEDADGTPRPRVLDFGVARITRNDDGAARTAATEAGHVVGTLQYMSPEQVQGGSVDTRSDVYALGLVAWEAIADRPARSIGVESLADVVRMIADQDPPALASTSRGVPLDLAIVIGKALEREQGRRYATAGEFASDLGRFLRDEPVAARAPTKRYLFARFARRHRTFVTAVMVIACVLVVALIVTATLLVQTRAARAAERQRALDSTAVADYFAWVLRLDPNAPGLEQIDVVAERARLKKLDDRIDERLGPKPLAKVRVLNLLAECYNRLTDYDESERVSRRSLAICDASLSPRHELRATALHNLAAAEWFRGAGDKALRVKAREDYEEALSIRKEVLGTEHSDTALTMRHLAAALRSLDRRDEAESLYRESLAIHERLHAAGDPLADTAMVASGFNGLASMLTSKGDHAEAARLFGKSLDLMRGMSETERRVVDEARVLRNLGVSQGILKQFDDGSKSLVDAEGIFGRQLGSTHREVAITRYRRAQLAEREGKLADARVLAQQVLDEFGLKEQDAIRADARRIADGKPDLKPIPTPST
ncbi:MAG: serine/threonine-protein kinase [Phycisphaerae bacterium]|nr:serine/threonine-protein kinase [Phycisphaerae bacterium]